MSRKTAWARSNLTALGKALYPHEGNNNGRKWVTILAVGVWSIITLGVAFGFAEKTSVYNQITYVVVAILFEQIGQEKARLKYERP